jgi:hypothetical protein
VARKRAIVAIAHTLIVVIWHMLTTGAPYTGLGAAFYARRLRVRSSRSTGYTGNRQEFSTSSCTTLQHEDAALLGRG